MKSDLHFQLKLAKGVIYVNPELMNACTKPKDLTPSVLNAVFKRVKSSFLARTICT